MQASAVIVVDDRSIASTASNADLAYAGRRADGRGSIAYAAIFGESLLDRTVKRLRKAGIQTIAVVGGPDLPSSSAYFARISTNRSCERWPAAQREVIRQNAQGIETVLMIGLNAYIEWDVQELLIFHRSHGMPLTQLCDPQGPLEVWAVGAEWFSTAALGCALPFRYGEFPGLPVSCLMKGYVNRLTGAHDLRNLVRDGFLSRCEVRPRCGEVRPGVWIENGARVHKAARLVAPVYLGASAKVSASAVITRFTHVEHNSKIGSGTVVDAASVFSNTEVGSGLEVSRAVLEGNTLIDVRRNLALCILDPKLIRDSAARPRGPMPDQNALQPAKNTLDFAYPSLFSRAAGRLSGVLSRD